MAINPIFQTKSSLPGGRIIIVRKDPGESDFSTIREAIASITEVSVIQIYPGEYEEDNSTPIILPPGSTVKAYGNSTVVITPSDPTKDLFHITSANTRLQGVTIEGVTSAKAVRILSSPTPAFLDFITISNSMIAISIEASTTTTQSVLRNIRLISGSTTTKLLNIEATGFAAIARIYSAIITDDDGTSFEAGIFATGSGARVEPNSALIRSTVAVGRGIDIDDGAHIHLSSGVDISGFSENLVFSDSGDAPSGDVRNGSILGGDIYDINIIHSDTFGDFTGVARRSKIINAAPTTFLLTYSDPDNANFNNTGMLITRGLSPELTTIATDGMTHQLTRFSAHATIFTGSTANTILKLADATTFTKTGHLYDVWNFSTVDIEIKDYDDTLLATLKPNGHTVIILRDISTSAGIWGLTYTIDNGNVFGTQLFYSESEAETSNNSATTWVNKITLVTPSLPSGQYMAQFQFNWRSSNADRVLEFRLQRGGSDIASGKPFTGSTQDRQLISGFKRTDSISGVQTFTLDFRRGASSTTVYMFNARLFVWRVS